MTATHNPLQSHDLHRPFHCAAGDIVAAATQLMPDLARPIPPPTTIEGLLDRCHVQAILPHPVRGQIRITLHSLEGIERRWCDPQNPADRPDTKDATVIVDERDHLRKGRSSFAAAKYALAFFRISLAWRSSRTSRSSSLLRSFSALVSPARCPLSRSACWHQTRSRASSQASARLLCRQPSRSRSQRGSLEKAEHRVHAVRQDRRG